MVLPFQKKYAVSELRNFSHEWSGVMSPGLFLCSNQTNPNVSKQISVSIWMRLVRNNALSLREKLGQN